MTRGCYRRRGEVLKSRKAKGSEPSEEVMQPPVNTRGRGSGGGNVTRRGKLHCSKQGAGGQGW